MDNQRKNVGYLLRCVIESAPVEWAGTDRITSRGRRENQFSSDGFGHECIPASGLRSTWFSQDAEVGVKCT